MATIAMTEQVAETAFLIFDTESVPDGELLSAVKYPGEQLSAAQSIERAQIEAIERSWKGSDFLPVTFHIPVSVCVLRAKKDLSLLAMTCLDAPHYRPREIAQKFWQGVASYPRAKLVTFNGRGFDLPLLELAAFRYGFSMRDYLLSRNRFSGNSLDLMEWMSNYGGYKVVGGLNLLAKTIGKPGKMGIAGDLVYQMHIDGKFQEINDYCLCDTFDTYFVFLRTRVMTGDISCERESELVANAKEFLRCKCDEYPALRRYLDEWQDDED